MIDNGSTDDWESKISSEFRGRITLTRDDGNYVQTISYNSLLPTLRQKHPHQWALIVDLDGFVYARPPHTIASYLSTVSDDINQVIIPW